MNGVYWIYGPNAGAGSGAGPNAGSGAASGRRSAREALAPLPLAVVLCPRGGPDLPREMQSLRRSGIDTLVSMLSHEQIDMLGLRDEGPLAIRAGMHFIHHPVPDHELPPDEDSFRAFVADLARRVRAGQRVGVHCWGSIGRATVTAACTLVHLGWNPATALAAVEAARGCPVPDTEEQERWILAYEAGS